MGVFGKLPLANIPRAINGVARLFLFIASGIFIHVIEEKLECRSIARYRQIPGGKPHRTAVRTIDRNPAALPVIISGIREDVHGGAHFSRKEARQLVAV